MVNATPERLRVADASGGNSLSAAEIHCDPSRLGKAAKTLSRSSPRSREEVRDVRMATSRGSFACLHVLRE